MPRPPTGERGTFTVPARASPTQRAPRSWLPAAVATTLIVALGVPTLWVVVARATPLLSDWALMELRTRDVFSAHPPLIGAWSRFGWAHPGPLPFFAYAIPYRLLGGTATALRIAAVIVNAGAMWATVWLLGRRGRASLALGACAIAATLWGMHAVALADPWNATIAVLPFLLAVVACWSVVCGDRPAILVATVAFLFTFQAHVGFGLVLIPVVAVTALMSLRSEVRRGAGRWFAGATIAAIILSLPLAVDTIANWPGNLERLVHWSVSNDVPANGLARGVRLIARQTSLSFLLSPQLPVFVATVVDPLPAVLMPGGALAALVATGIVAHRRALRDEWSLCVLLAVGWAGGLWAASSVRGEEYEWLFGWMKPLAFLTWTAAGLVAWRILAPSLRRHLSVRTSRLGGALAATVIVVVLAVGSGHRTLNGGFVLAELAAPLEAFTPAALTVIHDGPVLIDFSGDLGGAGGLQAGLVNELDRHGVDVKVDPILQLQFGAWRTDSGSASTHLLVTADGVTRAPPAGARALAVFDELSPADRAEVDQLTAELSSTLERIGSADHVPMLHTGGAALILRDDPPPAVSAEAPKLQRLAELRQHGGTRYVLYLLGLPS